MKRTIFDHCAVIGIDGMGNFDRAANTPNLDRIFLNGATTFDCLSMNPTISAENWGAMLLGALPMIHGLTNSSVSRDEYKNDDLPSVFRRLRGVFPGAYLTACCNWDPINHGIIEHDVGVDFATAGSDEELLPMILERVKKKPKFLFVQFDEVDEAGHHHGYGKPGHIEQIEKSDGLVGKIFDEYEKAGIADKTLFVVIADHGGNGRGHGGYTETEKLVFLGVRGAGVEKSKIGFARTVDIAAIVLYSLGLELPVHDTSGFASQVPEGIFPWYEGRYIVPGDEEAPPLSISKKTPDWNGSDGLPAFFGQDRIKLALSFDDTIDDSTGNAAFREGGSVKFYTSAPLSSCAELGETGFLFSEKPVFGSSSYTLSLFMLTSKAFAGGAFVLGNRDGSDGIELYLNDYNVDTIFNGGGRSDSVMIPFEESHIGSWVHYAFSVDFERGEVSFFTDFTFRCKRKLAEDIIASRSDFPLIIGTDCERKRNISDRPQIFRIDDLLVFDGVFGEDEMKKLKEYYEN